MFLTRLKTLLGMTPDCQQVNDFIAGYLEGALDAKTARKFEEHIRACSECAQYLDEYRTTIELVRDAGNLEPPPELVEMTLDFLRDHWDNGRGRHGD